MAVPTADSSLSWPTLGLALVAIYISVQLVQVWQKAGVVDALAQVPIADRDSWLFGNAGDRVGNDADGTAYVKTAERLKSNVFLWPLPTGRYVLVAGDNIMLNHILSDVRKFPSPRFRLEFIKFVVGGGIILAGPKEHATHRRIMGPAFTQSHIRSLTPLFTAKADELGQKIAEVARQGGHPQWNEDASRGTKAPVGKQAPIVNVAELIDAASFDIIGKAGFGADLGCIQKGIANVEFSSGYNEMLQASVKFNFARVVLLIVAGIFNPTWLSLPLNDANRVVRAQNKRLEALTADIIDKKIAKAKAEAMDDSSTDSGIGPTSAATSNGEVVDLVDMIVRSNLQQERKGAPVMSVYDLRGSIQTLIFAGYETSAVATSMCLYYLSQRPALQDKVRAEITTQLVRANEGLSPNDPAFRSQLTAEELQGPGFALLTNCIKETLRVVPAVSMTNREATEDCILPLGKPIPRRDGKGTISQLAIPKGTEMGVCLKLASANAEYWGDHPERWDPERWDRLPPSYKGASMPGPAGLPAFSNGPASCLGSRFAMLEIAALLVGVLRRVSVAPSPYHTVVAKQVIVARPTVLDKNVAALPLAITPLA